MNPHMCAKFGANRSSHLADFKTFSTSDPLKPPQIPPCVTQGDIFYFAHYLSMERSMLNITYKDRRTNIWVRERTKLIDIIYTVRKMKWSWAGHINRLKDDRWTSRVTTWRPYDKKRRQGRPAKRWRDDLDKYWSDTIWQRTAQDRVIWRRHAEAFAQPRDTTAA